MGKRVRDKGQEEMVRERESPLGQGWLAENCLSHCLCELPVHCLDLYLCLFVFIVPDRRHVSHCVQTKTYSRDILGSLFVLVR